MKLGLIAYNWEADTSLALWNLQFYALQEPVIAERVQFADYCSATPKSVGQEEQELFQVLRWIRDGQFDVVGFSCYIWNIKFVTRIAQAVKELWPQIRIVFGGQQIRGFYVNQVFERERCVDICVINEGEATFRKLLLSLLTGTPKLSQIGGLAYLAGAEDRDTPHWMTGKGGAIPAGCTVHVTGDPELVDDINLLPSPYLGEHELPMGGAFLYEASRGCPYRCAFCIWGESKGVREYHMERVEAELHNIMRHQPSHIMFCDGTFNMRKERATRILSILVDYLRDERVKPFSLLLEQKLEIIDDDLVKVMDELIKYNPLVTLEFGLQSASAEAAKIMRRPFTEERFRKAWDRLTPKLKSSAILDCIYGLPGDGIAEFMGTVDFAFSLAPHRIQCFRLSILPGSEFERQAQELDIKYNREPEHMVYETAWLDLDTMMWLEAFGFAVADLYHFHGNTIKCLLGLDGWTRTFSKLIADFTDWTGRGGIMDSMYGGNRPEGRWRAIDLSSRFEEYVFNVVLPEHGVSDPEILGRLRELIQYESALGQIAVRGLGEQGIRLGGAARPEGYLSKHALVLHSRYDLAGFVAEARGRPVIDVRAMRERDTYIAMTQKAGHQGVTVPISYRINNRLADVLERFRDGAAAEQVAAEAPAGVALLAAVQQLKRSGLLVEVPPRR